ncbi:MAG: hypothetical protein JO366_01750, partial [Methylobacteriaceae bacterium]|nr:hypothetical protein [Methylobacteriaceae bacterium]
ERHHAGDFGGGGGPDHGPGSAFEELARLDEVGGQLQGIGDDVLYADDLRQPAENGIGGFSSGWTWRDHG